MSDEEIRKWAESQADSPHDQYCEGLIEGARWGLSHAWNWKRPEEELPEIGEEVFCLWEYIEGAPLLGSIGWYELEGWQNDYGERRNLPLFWTRIKLPEGLK